MLGSNVRDRIGCGSSSSSKDRFINNVGQLAGDVQNELTETKEPLSMPPCVQATVEGRCCQHLVWIFPF